MTSKTTYLFVMRTELIFVDFGVKGEEEEEGLRLVAEVAATATR